MIYASVHSIDGLREKRHSFERVFHDPIQFKEMYRYAFTYVRTKDEKCIDVEVSRDNPVFSFS